MKRTIWVAAVAAVALAITGCPGKTSTEMLRDAFSDPELNEAEAGQKVQKALEKAEEEIAAKPEAIEPYVVKYAILREAGDFKAALETLHTALDRGKPANEAEVEKLKAWLITGYYRSNSSELILKGLRYVGELIKAEGNKNAYCYAMGLYYRKLYQLLGDGVYKTEANRWLLGCRLDDAQVQELNKEGLRDQLLE